MTSYLLLTRAAKPNALVTRIERSETTALFKALDAHRKASLTVNCDRLLHNLYDLFGCDNKDVPLYATGAGLTVHHASLLSLFNVVSAALVSATQTAAVHNAWFVRETEQTQEEFEEDDLEEEEDDDTDDLIDDLMDSIERQVSTGDRVKALAALGVTLDTQEADGELMEEAYENLDRLCHELGPERVYAAVKLACPEFEWEEMEEGPADQSEPPVLATSSDDDEEEEEDEDFEEEEDDEDLDRSEELREGYVEAVEEVVTQLSYLSTETLCALSESLKLPHSNKETDVQLAAHIVAESSRDALTRAFDKLEIEPSLELIMALDEKADQEYHLGLKACRVTEGPDDDEDLDPMENAFAENAEFAHNYKLIEVLARLQSAIAEQLREPEPGAMTITVHH